MNEPISFVCEIEQNWRRYLLRIVAVQLVLNSLQIAMNRDCASWVIAISSSYPCNSVYLQYTVINTKPMPKPQTMRFSIIEGYAWYIITANSICVAFDTNLHEINIGIHLKTLQKTIFQPIWAYWKKHGEHEKALFVSIHRFYQTLIRIRFCIVPSTVYKWLFCTDMFPPYPPNNTFVILQS